MILFIFPGQQISCHNGQLKRELGDEGWELGDKGVGAGRQGVGAGRQEWVREKYFMEKIDTIWWEIGWWEKGDGTPLSTPSPSAT